MECKSIQSIASSSMTRRYDVFVSFRGEDVRNSFADHLFGALQRKGIVAFRDDRNIKQGEHISTELIEAIEESQVLIVVFSKNFATSSWCLRELAKIVDCMNREVPAGHQQVVMPVFYDVSPSEVRKQSGDYGKAFAEHEQRFKHDLEMVQSWREALVQVANLFGSDIQNKPQFTEIDKIVKRVMSILGNKFSCLPDGLVGMHSHLDELEKFLVLVSHNDVQVIGIWGMGGIGKTTLAQVLYHRISHQYDASCFIDDVSKVYEGHGLLGVHKQLHCQVLKEENQEVWSISRATYLTRTILSKIKAFIVLDNVDEVKQLEGLAVNRDLLCAGSKIIVVSRNKHIFEQFGVNKVYQVQCLNEDDALQLFCRRAFRSDYVLREYEELTYRALEYAQGHPLAIRVLGSFLLGLNISEWTSALDRLRDDPDKEIMNVLRISVDGLGYTEKEIFLDIACFFNFQDSIQVKRILSCFGFHPKIGIRVLIDQSLISVDQGGVIRMHDMLVELGKKIVREKAPKDPRKWSRIWRNKDFQNIISDKMTMEVLEAVQLDRDVQEIHQKKTSRAEVLSAMSHLRLLIVKDAYFSGSLDCLSNKLQYLNWFGYPFNNLPSSFEPNELVEMILPCSTITTLWEGTKHLHSLRIMNLQHSKNLIKTPDFRGLTNLEELDLEGCTKLVEIHPSIGLLGKLIVLNLKNCISLRSLPYSVFCLSSLEVLNLSRCSKVFSNQLSGNGRHVEHLKKLDVSETGMMRKSTSSILKKISFQFFSSPKKNKIVGLLSPSFQCLQELDLYFCNLHRIPDAIGCLHGLEKLNLGGNNFVALPSSMKELPRLKSLYLMHCQQLKHLPELTLSTDLLPKTKTTFVFYENFLPGLYIFNCPNLIEIENWSNIAVSWMIQFLKIHHQSWPRRAEFHCVVPGSQAPMWFDKQSSDNSLVLDPVLMHDSEWIGLALCAAFVAPVGYSAILDESTGHLPMQFSLGRSATGSAFRACDLSAFLEMDCKSIASSSSSITRRYDVFVSFRGEDVRNNFADHLFAAFQRKGIVAFRDDTNMKQGEHISTELMEAIEGSHVLIVVFSKNYANSSWCLQELAKIVDCINREVPTGQRQIVMPVFYDVSPSEVRKQSGDFYGKAFAEHEHRFQHDLGMVQRWREALEQVANLSGSDLQSKPQFKETEKIVKRVMSILGNKSSCLPNDLVGMHSHLNELEKHLVLDSHNDVQVIGIWGMGGIGKTTLAQVLYHRISHQYDASCYIDDVSKIYQSHGPLGVHKQLHCQVLNEENQEVWNLSKATYLTRTILSRVKAFIVLDNVNEVEQLEGLAVNRELICAGSKIIIVSRNKHIFEQLGVNKVYQVQCLNEVDSRHLFCRKAFKCDYILRECEELTRRALYYAQGHPLAIKILGSFLLGRDISEWRSALDSLGDNPKREIMDVLRISFDRLERTQKEIFLDIACFFNFKHEVQVKRILNCCGFHPDIGVRVLIDQSLITVDHGEIRMHEMLVELGKKIVREKAPTEPGKWSRIWYYKDFRNIVIDEAMEDLKALQLLGYPRGRNQKEALRAEVLSAMSRLRLLIINEDTNFSGSLDCLSNKLQYLKWRGYPFTYLPSSFEPTKLVELILPGSKIKRLWEGTKHLHNLRIMDLGFSENLIKTPNFRGLTNLEELNLEQCTKLVEIHPSIGLLKKLRVLNLRECTSLRSLPYSVFGLSSLEVLNLSRCSKVFNNQLLGDGRHAEHLKKLGVSEAAMECKSSSSILKRFSFQFFSTAKKNEIVGLLLPSFQCLQELNLYFCNLPSIPDAIGCLHGLEKLNLGGNNFVTLPSSMMELPRLKSLYLTHCKKLKYLPELTLSTDLLPSTRTGFVDDENKLPGLYIFNCPKLMRAKSWSNIVISWMIQFLKVHHQSWPRLAEVHCVVPGSEVPRWFDNRSAGNTIMLDPALMHDSDWIGLALCAAFVVTADDHSTILDENPGDIRMHFSLSDCELSGIGFFIPVLMEKDLVKVDSDHLFLLYLPRESLITDRMEIFLSFSSFRNRLVVKQWGFRCVLKQNLKLQELTQTMSNLSLERQQYVG